MKWTAGHSDYLVRLLIDEWDKAHVLDKRASREDILNEIKAVVREELDKEVALEAEVNKIMDDLEQKSDTAFERYKMFPMLKQKLAKKKGIIL